MAEFNWAIVDQDGSVIDRFRTRDEALADLRDYGCDGWTNLNIEWSPDPWVYDNAFREVIEND